MIGNEPVEQPDAEPGAPALIDLACRRTHPGARDIQMCPWRGFDEALEELRGGDAKENAVTLEGILSGEIKGPKREMAVANAAAGFVVAELSSDMNEGIARAREQIDGGRALAKLLTRLSPAGKASLLRLAGIDVRTQEVARILEKAGEPVRRGFAAYTSVLLDR